MKFDFWFDLPSALSNVIEESLTMEEVAYCKILSQSAEAFKAILYEFGNNFEENQNQIILEELELINAKLQSIHKQTVELLCKCVKFSTKLMMKIIEIFENYPSSSIPLNELLVKIKLFSKITRLILEKSKPKNLSSSSQEVSEFKFFSMLDFILILNRIHIFTEKIQRKMYKISNSIIQTFMNQKKPCENQISSWNQMQIVEKESLENTSTC